MIGKPLYNHLLIIEQHIFTDLQTTITVNNKQTQVPLSSLINSQIFNTTLDIWDISARHYIHGDQIKPNLVISP